MFTVLTNIMKKTEKEFKKIKTFNIFKMNPFLYNNKNVNTHKIPNLVMEMQKDFDKYIKKHDSLKTISLNYE